MTETTDNAPRSAAEPALTPAQRLWQIWRQGQRPDVAVFLAGAEGLPSDQVAAALLVDQRERWHTGERIAAEAYLDLYPQRRDDFEFGLELVYGEYLLREACGEAPVLEDYARRFPAYAERLQMQVELHRAMKSGAPTRALSTDGHESPPTLVTTAGQEPLASLTVPGYELLGELGRGGMGVVYKARQTVLNRLVALKMVLAGAQASEARRDRFRQEAEAVARLQHPNIVQIHEVGSVDGCPFFSLEFAAGGSLDRRLRGTPQPARAAAELVETLARAMAAAHEAGIVHRDLKPGNILLSADGRPKITDFGLAKCLDEDSQQTNSGVILGTPSYMAPEQALGKNSNVGPAADVYALGAILYELLTGRPPFKAETAMDTMFQVIHEEPVSPGRLQPRLPRDLEVICLKCLRKVPGQRYATALGLASDLRRFLDGEPIRARSVGVLERVSKWARRHPGVTALALATWLIAEVGFGLVVWKWREAEQAHQESERARQSEGEMIRLAERARMQEESAREIAELRRRYAYLGDLALCNQLWDMNQAAPAESVLDACPADLRDWEWNYLKRRCHAERLVFRADRSGVNALAVSADGKRLATGGGDLFAADTPGAVLVFEAPTGRKLFTLEGHTGPVCAVAFSPDGELLASASLRLDLVALVREGKFNPPRGEVKIWRISAPDERATTLEGHCGTLAFSADGKRLAAAGVDQTIGVWNTANWEKIHTLRGHHARVGSLAFSPDGKRLASAATQHSASQGGLFAAHGELKTWDLKTGKEAVSFGDPDQSLGSVACSPDGTLLAAGAGDATVRLWDSTTGRPVRVLRGHGDGITHLAFRPDGLQLVSTGTDRTARLWDLNSGTATLILRAHADTISGAAFLPAVGDAAPELVTAARDGLVKVWNTQTGQGPLRLAGHRRGIAALAFHPDGDRLVTSGPDGTLRTWDTRTGRQLRQTPCPVSRVVFAADGRRFITGGGNPFRQEMPGTLTLWDADTGKELGSFNGHTRTITALALSPDGRTLISASGMEGRGTAGEVIVSDATTRERLGTIDASSGCTTSIAFHPDGRTSALAGMGPTVRIFDWRQRTEVGQLQLEGGKIYRVAFSPDGKHLAGGSLDGRLVVWEIQTGREVMKAAGRGGSITGLAYHPSGNRLATASFDATTGKGEIKVWDVHLGREVLLLPGFVSVAFSPDGTRLAYVASESLGATWEVHVLDGTPLGP